MANSIPGWLRFGLLGGAVAAGLGIAVLFLVPTDDPSPFVVAPTVRRPPAEMSMRPLASPHFVEESASNLASGPLPSAALPSAPTAASIVPVAPGPVSAPAPAHGPTVAAAPAAPPATVSTPEAAATPAKPAFDVVTMSTAGSAVIAGRAVPNADVTVRSGGTDLGHVTADQRGNWVLLPDKKLAVGPQTLTLAERLPNGTEIAGNDHVDFVVPPPEALAPVGAAPVKVAANAAPETARDANEAVTPGSEVVVQPGENLWHMAKSAYGSGPRYIVIYRANQDKIREPNRIYPGQALAVPPASSVTGSNVMPDSSIKSR